MASDPIKDLAAEIAKRSKNVEGNTKITCRTCGSTLVKTPTGFGCPKCGQGSIVISGDGASIKIS